MSRGLGDVYKRQWLLYLIRSLSVWTFLELHVLERFPFGVTVEFVKIRFMGFLCLGDVV